MPRLSASLSIALLLVASGFADIGADSAKAPAATVSAAKTPAATAPAGKAEAQKKAGPARTEISASTPAFDSLRAYRYLKEQCDFGPRNPGSEGHKRALDYFEKHFRGLGLAVALQPFIHTDVTDGRKVALTNVIATAKGRDARHPGIILCAHWDTRPRADQENSTMLQDRPIIGANDGASGAAILMELANAFKRRPPARTVHIVLFDGEDYGRSGSLEEYFLGARHFADHLPTPRPEYAVLLDMVGDRDLSLPMERNSMGQQPDLVRRIWERARSLNLSAFRMEPGPVVFDDHMPLLAKELPAVDIIDFEYPAWHTTGDTPDKCSAHSLGVVGRLVASLAFKPLP